MADGRIVGDGRLGKVLGQERELEAMYAKLAL
jgi:hypothetical protein